MTDMALMDAVGTLMREASERVILPRFSPGGRVAASEKSPGEPVTIADRECEALLSEGLARLLPAASVIGEEAVAAEPGLLDGAADALCWIIDPLDGTANFARGDPTFGVMVALAEHGIPIAGWMLAPVTGRLCRAARGQGAWIDGERVQSRDTAASPRLGISTLFGDEPRRQALAQDLAGQWQTVPLPRCAAEVYPGVVLGRLDAALFGRTLPWDHAAGQIFVVESGGVAQRLDGSPYRIDDASDGMIAAASEALWHDLAGHARSALA